MAVAGGAPCTVSLAYAYRIYEKELCEGHGGVHKAFTGNIGRLGPRYIYYIFPMSGVCNRNVYAQLQIPVDK